MPLSSYDLGRVVIHSSAAESLPGGRQSRVDDPVCRRRAAGGGVGHLLRAEAGLEVGAPSPANDPRRGNPCLPEDMEGEHGRTHDPPPKAGLDWAEDSTGEAEPAAAAPEATAMAPPPHPEPLKPAQGSTA